MLRMGRGNEQGFTLIEVILVMAISASLLAVVLVGQRGLRSRAQFDAAVNKFVASVSDAHTQAMAGVNIIGAGDGSNGCTGAPGGQYVFAGIAWTADDSLPGTVKLDYYKALPGVVACIFQTQAVGLPASIQVNASNPLATRGGRVLFVRDGQGGLQVCPVTDLTTDVTGSFQAGVCATGTLALTLSDADGHTSQVTIDQSGLARRQN